MRRPTPLTKCPNLKGLTIPTIFTSLFLFLIQGFSGAVLRDILSTKLPRKENIFSPLFTAALLKLQKSCVGSSTGKKKNNTEQKKHRSGDVVTNFTEVSVPFMTRERADFQNFEF